MAASTKSMPAEAPWRMQRHLPHSQGSVSVAPLLSEVVSLNGNGSDIALDPSAASNLVNLLNMRLSRLLKLRPKEFWQNVVSDDSLQAFVNSYLHFRHRSSDYNKNNVFDDNVIDGDGGGGDDNTCRSFNIIHDDADLCRRIFMLLFRMSSIEEQDVPQSERLMRKQHASIIYEKKLFGISKLINICAIYGPQNFEITQKLVNNVISSQPKYLDDDDDAIDDCDDVKRYASLVILTFDSIKKRIVEILKSGDIYYGDGMVTDIKQEFEDIAYYIHYVCSAMNLFLKICSYSSSFFLVDTAYSDGSSNLMSCLSAAYGITIPLLKAFCNANKSFSSSKSNSEKKSSQTTFASGNQANNKNKQEFFFLEECNRLLILEEDIIELTWQLLSYSHLGISPPQGDFSLSEPLQILIQNKTTVEKGEAVLKSIIELSTFWSLESDDLDERIRQFFAQGSLIFELQRRHNLFTILQQLHSAGKAILSDSQMDYIQALIFQPHHLQEFPQPHHSTASGASQPSIQYELQQKEKINERESDGFQFVSIATEQSKIENIKDLFPDYEDEFLRMCLRFYAGNEETVIQNILENNLHPDIVARMGTSTGSAALSFSPGAATTTAVPSCPPLSSTFSEARKAKGKQKMEFEKDVIPADKNALLRRTSSPSFPSASWSGMASGSTMDSIPGSDPKFSLQNNQVGRYVRKKKEDEMLADIPLPKSSESAKLKSFVNEYKYEDEDEYEDEYDDSFDDLGVYEVVSGETEAESLSSKFGSKDEIAESGVEIEYAHELPSFSSKQRSQGGSSRVDSQKDAFRKYGGGSMEHGGKETLDGSEPRGNIPDSVSKAMKGLKVQQRPQGDSFSGSSDDGKKKRGGATKLDTALPSGGNTAPKHENRSRTPQFFVKDGKNYSYNVQGSVAVNSAEEAEILRRLQKEAIYGLGRGGNKAMHQFIQNADERMGEEDEEDGGEQNNLNSADSGAVGPAPRGGRGRGRGREWRGRGIGRGGTAKERDDGDDANDGANANVGENGNAKVAFARKEKHKAVASNHNRKDRALRKHTAGLR